MEDSQSTSQPVRYQRLSLLKTCLSLILLSVVGIVKPLLVIFINKIHKLLSVFFIITMIMNSLIGALLILLVYMITPMVPRLGPVVGRLAKLRFVLVWASFIFSDVLGSHCFFIPLTYALCFFFFSEERKRNIYIDHIKHPRGSNPRPSGTKQMMYDHWAIALASAHTLYIVSLYDHVNISTLVSLHKYMIH